MALAPLAPFVAALVALGLAALLTLLVLALIHVLSQAPVIGGWIANKAVEVEHAVSNALGQAFSGIDAFIAGTIHNMARRVEQAAWALQDAAQATLQVAESLNPATIAAHVARVLAHATAQALHGIEHGLRTIEREFKGIEAGVKRLERDLTRGIGHDLRLQVTHLERELTQVRRRVIPSIRSDVATAEGEITHLYDWAKGKAALLGIGTFAMAVAAVLDTLGLGGIKCPSFGNLFNKRGCGLWNGLENLLGWFVDALILVDLCGILPEIVHFFGDVEGVLTGLISQAANAVCAAANPNWTTISVTPGPLPTAQAFDSSTLAPDV